MGWYIYLHFTIENIPSPMDPIRIDTARYVSKILQRGHFLHQLKSAVIKFYPAFVRGKRQKTMRSYVRRMFSQYLGFTCSVCFRKSHVRHCSVSPGINGQKISSVVVLKKQMFTGFIPIPRSSFSLNRVWESSTELNSLNSSLNLSSSIGLKPCVCFCW